MVTGVVNNMSADKLNQIEIEVKEIHTHIRKSNLNLREKIKMIQEEMTAWPSIHIKDAKRKSRKSVR
jgi:hypothetical protein